MTRSLIHSAGTPGIPARATPSYAVRELHATLTWVIVSAIGLLVYTGSRGWTAKLHGTAWLAGDEHAAAGCIEAAGLSVVAAWSGWCLLSFFSAISRLKADCPAALAEEALRRQKRLWMSVTLLAGLHVIFHILLPSPAAGPHAAGEDSPSGRVAPGNPGS